jgi:hypothetical protein
VSEPFWWYDQARLISLADLFPLRLASLLWSSDRDLSDLMTKYQNSSLSTLDPMKTLKKAIPEKIPIEVTEIIPRLKDGGAFVKFSHPPGEDPKGIEATLNKMLESEPIKPWFNPFRGVKASLVQGVPWLEDLYRLPRNRLKVEFSGQNTPELAQETLYSLFRKYGKISEITPQPSDSKVLPKFAYVDFKNVRDAIMARNCLHGFEVQGAPEAPSPVRLRLSYEKRQRSHPTWDWLTNHPRIVIPILAALVAAITVAIFDPIREFFIKVSLPTCV